MAQKIYKDGKYTGKEILTEKEHQEKEKQRRSIASSPSSPCLICKKVWKYNWEETSCFNEHDSKFLIKTNWSNLKSNEKLKLITSLNPKTSWKPDKYLIHSIKIQEVLPISACEGFLKFGHGIRLRQEEYEKLTYKEHMNLKQLYYNLYDECKIGYYRVHRDGWMTGTKTNECVCKNCVPEYIKNPDVRTKSENNLVWYKNNTVLILLLIFCFPAAFYGLYKRWCEK